MKKSCLFIIITTVNFTLLIPSKVNASSFSPHSSNSSFEKYSIEHSITSLNESKLAFNNVVSSPNQAAQIVKRRFGGKILNVKASRFNGAKGYKVKLVNQQGKVLTVFVNSSTGRVSQL